MLVPHLHSGARSKKMKSIKIWLLLNPGKAYMLANINESLSHSLKKKTPEDTIAQHFICKSPSCSGFFLTIKQPSWHSTKKFWISLIIIKYKPEYYQ